jgi:hypothetical protein
MSTTTNVTGARSRIPWRRIERVPPPPEVKYWLYGVARLTGPE